MEKDLEFFDSAEWGEKLEDSKVWDSIGDIAKNNIVSGIQDAFDDDFDMSSFI